MADVNVLAIKSIVVIRSLKSIQIIIFRILIFLNNVVYDTPYKCLPVVPTGGIKLLRKQQGSVNTLSNILKNVFQDLYIL